jgi:hypothetical protein
LPAEPATAYTAHAAPGQKIRDSRQLMIGQREIHDNQSAAYSIVCFVLFKGTYYAVMYLHHKYENPPSPQNMTNQIQA